MTRSAACPYRACLSNIDTHSHFSACRATATLLLSLAMITGCNKSLPTEPRRLPAPAALSVTAVLPNAGPPGSAVDVRILGTGFQAGATVTMDGAATNVTVVSSTLITATTPIHAAGTVDVVVTNPAGQSVRLPAAYTFASLAITTISPASGLVGDVVRIFGTGFATGAAVTFGTVSTRVVQATSNTIMVMAPVHASGTVDVVVSNPDGESVTVTDGYTYQVVTLSVSSNVVAAGSQVTVSWVAPTGRPLWDWVALFKVGTPNTIYGDYEYTKGAIAGSLTFTAPAQAGQYEFRYLINDGYIDAARSGPVTVTAGGD